MVGRVMQCSVLFIFLPNIFLPSPSDERDDELPPGLVATYSPGFAGQPVERIDSDIQFNWGDASPDPRVPADRFEVHWRGSLFVPATAQYRFHLFACGTARLSINGKQVIAGATNEARWLSSAETSLDLGYHTIDVSFTKTAAQARIGLYWESNKFGLEPIGPRWLFHEKSADREPGEFERGGELVRAFRCAGCHEIPGVEQDGKAPALEHLADRIHPSWLVRWLQNPHDVQADARMPATGLSRDDARVLASFLLSASKKPGSPAKPTSNTGRPDAGDSLVRSLGCLACHTLDGSGNPGQFGGGPLDRIAEKRPVGFFREWLKKPESLNAAHRMPVFTLTNDEVEDLTSFLSTRGEPQDEADADATRAGGKEEINRGKQLVVDHRCAACHEIPGIEQPDRTAVPLGGARPGNPRIDWDRSCLGQADVTRHKPQFTCADEDRQAIRAFIDQLPAKVARQSQYELGRRLLQELNCASCHPRDLDHGLQPAILGRTAEGAETELAKLRGELEPPSLTSVGDKFHDATLAKLIEGGLTPRRPWLKVRMPRFTLRNDERDAIVSHLVNHDRIPGNPPSSILDPQSAPVLDSANALTAGHQLVSARGFGCMSCHTVGKHQPKAVAVNARGSDLLKIGDRVRHEWFLRWTRDPARIVPGMEMPSITVPVRGIMNDRLDLQIESLWQALNSPSFVVPSDRDTATQILALQPGDQPVILRDVMLDCPPGSGWCPRSFAIGLPNRHNVLFDLDMMSLRGWWFGDFARQRPQAKTWLWEPAGLPVWDRWSPRPSIVLRHPKTGAITLPERDGQTFGKLESWDNSRQHVHFRYRLRLLGTSFEVLEWIEATNGERSGFIRRVMLRGGFIDHEPMLLLPAAGAELIDNEWISSGPLGRTAVRAVAEGAKWLVLSVPRENGGAEQSIGLALQPDAILPRSGPRYAAELTYLAEVPAKSPAHAPSGAAPAAPAGAALAADVSPAALRKQHQVPVAPGFAVTRLPLEPSVMPTAVAFRRDGTPVVCSLKGQVFLARDSDGDGLEDAWHAFSDHLAAPFGVLTIGDEVIVSHKPEVVSLQDHDRDSLANHVAVIASGWGYNEDYHDWTVGLVRDSQGRFLVTTGSDYGQKDRPKEARKWRGHALRISPDGKIEDLARGIRFSNGIAMNRAGDVFFTDNQGVQNTFNEINHIVPGSRYGVPALDDPPPDKDPWPEREPAIKIPHPWTRSVNGICFLESGGKWGPFEGHGIGCEYDTRGLIRFSLQKIGDTYQGACYPFTLPEDQVPQDQRLLGPICCAVSPNGDLYVGGLRDSGWGGGNNVGELVRIKPSENIPLGIREVRAWRDGFVIEFTGSVDAAAAADSAKYTISSYHRIWQGTYATPDSDRRAERIRTIAISQDLRTAVITLHEMRPGFVYDISIRPIGPDAQALWPADAYYTLNQVPEIDAEERKNGNADRP